MQRQCLSVNCLALSVVGFVFSLLRVCVCVQRQVIGLCAIAVSERERQTNRQRRREGERQSKRECMHVLCTISHPFCDYE